MTTRLPFLGCFLLTFLHACAQSLPVLPYIPYSADSFAARNIRFLAIAEYNFDRGDSLQGTPHHTDSLVFNSSGNLSETWSRYGGYSYKLLTGCDSVNEEYYMQCDSAGREVFRASGNIRTYTRYDTAGYIQKEGLIIFPRSSDPEITDWAYTYDHLHRLQSTYVTHSFMREDSTDTVDTVLFLVSYNRCIYKKGKLTEVQYGLGSLRERRSNLHERYFYSGSEITRIEYSIDHGTRRTRKTTLHKVWLVQYGYAQ